MDFILEEASTKVERSECRSLTKEFKQNAIQLVVNEGDFQLSGLVELMLLSLLRVSNFVAKVLGFSIRLNRSLIVNITGGIK